MMCLFRIIIAGILLTQTVWGRMESLDSFVYILAGKEQQLLEFEAESESTIFIFEGKGLCMLIDDLEIGLLSERLETRRINIVERIIIPRKDYRYLKGAGYNIVLFGCEKISNISDLSLFSSSIISGRDKNKTVSFLKVSDGDIEQLMSKFEFCRIERIVVNKSPSEPFR